MKLKDCRNFSEVLFYHSQHNPDKVFVHDLRSQRQYSFKEFNHVVEKVASYLVAKGIKPGDRVTALIENSPEYCFFYFATLRVGAIFNPMPFTSHKEEVKKNVNYVEPRLVLIDSRRFQEFAQESNIYNSVPVGGQRLFEEELDKLDSTLKPYGNVPIEENSAACLYYSSGTTGNPKGILFSHKNMIANISSICRGFKFNTDNEVHLVFLPLGHTASINYSFLPCMYLGANMVLAESFWRIRLKIWEIIEKEKITYMEVVPTVLYSILNMHRDTAGCDVSSLRFVGCGSAPLQKGIQEEFDKRFGLKVANLYGLSETGPTHIDYPLAKGWQPGSVGVPLDVNEADIFNEQGNSLGAGEVGQIVIKGDNVFVGYFKNNALYNQVVNNGYFYTGDIGYKDENGVFYYVDRIKDLIIKGGTNIAPSEIDEAIISHPAVKEAVTVGMPDVILGEEIKSFVVLKDGVQISVQDIDQHCRKYLPSLKVPKEIEIVEFIPKTHSGKLLRKEVRGK